MSESTRVSRPESEHETETDRLARCFLERTLPKSEWTHEAHLRVGLWHLLHYRPDQALDQLRTAIRTYNESVGGMNTDDSGYHETITRFYVLVIDRFLDGKDRSRPLDALAQEMIAEIGQKDLPLRYYSKDRLMSVEARRQWVEPDRQPI